MEEAFMKQAIDEACKGVAMGDGGPFGAVIVRNNEVIATGHNLVVVTNDATAHAEMTAIRSACAKLKDFKLTNCVLYTSCYPCPMCMGAVLWAGIKEVYYSATAVDAEMVGFGDKIYHDFVKNPELGGEMCRYIALDIPDKLLPFRKWSEKSNRVPY